MVKARKISKPDEYNNYGTRAEHDADMKKLSREFKEIKDGLQTVIPGLSYRNDRFYYAINPVTILVDGLEAHADDLTYSPEDVESIRMIDPSLLMVTTKRFAGTDTVGTVKLKEVKINSHKINNKPTVTHSDNLNGAGNADQVIMGDKLADCIMIADCLRGKIAGVQFAQDGTPYRTHSTHLKGPKPMVIVVDGNMMSGSQMNNINASDIYSIEVLESGGSLALYGSDAADGALIITTKRGTDGSFVTSDTPTKLISYPFAGFNKPRTFYLPKYNPLDTGTKKPDKRTTIYWNPNVITDKDGKAQLEYFNADTKGTYRVVVEGIDDYGNIGRAVYRYKVE
jgi:hypothetical protein